MPQKQQHKQPPAGGVQWRSYCRAAGQSRMAVGTYSRVQCRKEEEERQVAGAFSALSSTCGGAGDGTRGCGSRGTFDDLDRLVVRSGFALSSPAWTIGVGREQARARIDAWYPDRGRSPSGPAYHHQPAKCHASSVRRSPRRNDDY